MKQITYKQKNISSQDIKLSTDAYLRNKQIMQLAYQIDEEVRATYDDWFITKPVSLDRLSSLEDLDTYYGW